MAPEPDRYAVIGHPIAHSRSPWIHARFAAQTGQRVAYTAIDADSADLAGCVRDFFARGGRGMNVTIPHKQAVLPLLSDLSERARIAGAVNVIVHEGNDRNDGLRGDNTDGIGLVRDLTHNLGVAVAGQRVLLLGAGGAARGLVAPLLELQPLELVIANRSPDRAVALAREFGALGPVRGATFAALEAERFALIINATAAGLSHELPPLPSSVLAAASVCYDLCYARGTLRFLQWAQQLGVARCFSGAGMLVEQAAESFLLWRGIRPETASVIAELIAQTAAAPAA
jgi:shikimate dehydrogenase